MFSTDILPVHDSQRHGDIFLLTVILHKHLAEHLNVVGGAFN
jgi:hypothetical protein